MSKPSPLEATETLKHKAESWITDGAWISGVAGAVTVVLLAMFYNAEKVLDKGLNIAGWQLTTERTDSLLAALCIITIVMVGIECIRLFKREGGQFIHRAPELSSGQTGKLFGEALISYILNLILIGGVTLFYHSAGEYGFANKAPYYQPWFRLLEWIAIFYAIIGLPYGFVTRAFRHNPLLDKKDLSTLTGRVLAHILSFVPGLNHLRPEFDENDKKAVLGLVVKMFFTPLMTVFFCDQFPHLIANVGYLLEGLPRTIADGYYTHAKFNGDFFNISISLIFSIDVALAWCGYMVSSRWVDNQTASAEPSVLGWMVCISCYPPFQMLLGFYFSAPGEHEVLKFTNQWMITVFTTMMVCSYIVYMSATLWFGVRFSNLTNRGIIRKGPFAYIRHPAYASKNFAWWCVMFPAIIYNAQHTGFGLAGMQIVGLVLMTYTYYLRAITEERHLSADPMYLEYCKQVPYRFIPKVL
jgi:protein-S-isoprenylcysteine O-methyltransferase Ste14